jgi:hypothetical protein
VRSMHDSLQGFFCWLPVKPNHGPKLTEIMLQASNSMLNFLEGGEPQGPPTSVSNLGHCEASKPLLTSDAYKSPLAGHKSM